MATPFTAYNKIQPEPGALVGNWVEERSLQDKTGAHRGFDESLTRTLPKGTLEKGTLPGPMASTFLRTIEHTERTEVGNWKSTQRDYRGEWIKEDPFRYETSGLGPRERRELEALKMTAATLPPPPAPEHDLNSTQRASFVPHDPIPLDERGKRVMKDRDGRPVTRDFTFLAESGMMTRAEADTAMFMTQKMAPPELASTALITTGITAPGHPVVGSDQDFRRYAEFTRPIGEAKKAQIGGTWAREW